MKREFSAGGIIYKKEGNKTVWLVRFPKMNPNYKVKGGWGFPKGWIDKGEGLEQAAIREVSEEAGIQARIIKKIPTIKFFYTDFDTKEKIMKFVTYFLMEWEKDTPQTMDNETESTLWGEYEEILGKLTYSSEKKLFKEAYKLFTVGPGVNSTS